MNNDNNNVDMSTPIDNSAAEEILKGFAELDGEVSNTSEESKVETTTDSTNTEVSTETDSEKNENTNNTTETKEQSLNPPTQYEGESETQYQIRTEIWRAGRAKAAAETEEEKSLISQHIKELRKGLGEASIKAKQTQTTVETTENQAVTNPDEEEAARVALEKLGYIDKKGIEAMVQQALQAKQAETAAQEHTQAISEFYKSRPDITADSNRKAILENYVIENFNITPNTTKRQLSAHLEMAANYLFPKVNKSANAQEAAAKRAIVNASSNTKTDVSTESMASDLRKLGFTEDDIKNSGW